MAQPNRTHRSRQAPTDPPKRRHGGQELPDDVQDRPEQNAGYDQAVRGGSGRPVEPRDDAEVDDLERTPESLSVETDREDDR